MFDNCVPSWLQRLAARHFGSPCALCAGSRAHDGVCTPCRTDLPWLTESGCIRCAGNTPAGEICGRCLAQPPAFDRVLAATGYAFPVDAMIQRFKFAGDLWLAPVLAGFMQSRIEGTRADLPHCLLPLPLSDRRLAERGFNQSGELARELSRRLRVPVRLDVLRRGRDTAAQSGLPIDARAANIRGAFVVDRPVDGLHAAIVDDVVTTGATAHEAALALKRCGARTVEIWAAARTRRLDGH